MQLPARTGGLFVWSLEVPNSVFYSVSAPAGSGKTYAAIGHAIQLAQNGQKVLIAQPSIPLITQTEADLRAHPGNVQVEKIVSQPGTYNKTSVLARILDHMQKTDPFKGEVLLISQEALGRLPDAYRKHWHLIVDELPQAFTSHEMNMAKSHAFVTSHLKLDDALSAAIPDVMVVEASDVGALRDLSENKTKDRAFALFKDLVDDVLNEDKLVCVNAADYAELVSGSGKRRDISFYSFQKSEYVKGFQSVTMMGANFDDTEIAHIWSRLDSVEWKPHPVIGQNLRYQTHTNGHRLTIKYLIQGNWSQAFADKPHENAIILDAVCTVMEQELGDDFLWQSNKKHEDRVFEEGVKLPQVVHGINHPKFVKRHGVALVKAINHSSGSAAFLKAIGFTAEELKVTVQYQNEYQAMMRCSLRDPRATEPVTVCVVSEGSAKWLQARFPGSTVKQVVSLIPEPGTVGAPKKAVTKSGAERKWDTVERSKARIASANGQVYQIRPWPGLARI